MSLAQSRSGSWTRVQDERQTVVERDVHEPDPDASAARHIPGEAGLWILIMGEMVIFAGVFAVFGVHRIGRELQFDQASRSLNLTLGMLNTVILVTSSALVAVAVRTLRGVGTAPASKALAAAIGLGLLFCGVKVVEYIHVAHLVHTSSASDFYLYFFILTGLHLVHVLIGLAVLVLIWRRSRAGTLAPRQLIFVEGGACYWHMVDAVWLVIFPLLYLVR